ncbi:MAG: UDP-N-acetylmuramoyl-tripeptide--D-alanyl-D-alanine ligase [Bacilli bacterium]|nr:UDP-N-acetylmuramoyl-tripeptide--D-alanyl-D-alanine ligase [Bacilli bacterium]
MNIIFILSIVVYIAYYNIISTRSLHMLQQNRYNRGYRYIKWILRNFKDNFINLNLMFLIFILTSFNETLNNLSSLIFIVIYVFLGYVYIDKKRGENAKLPLKYTARIKRLIATNNIVHLIPVIIILLTFTEEGMSSYYILLGLLVYLDHFLILLDNFLNRPAEKLVGLHFEQMAKDKLASMNNMDVIGVTGSYGKTSTKNILYDILSIKYNVFKTPSNYNTPYGLMITINNYLDKYNDYFIAEMGACKQGEIKELCDLVHPKYGILTRIGLAHLETFGSEEIIQSTKFELIESLPHDGLGVLNGDDEKQLSYKIKNDCKIKWIGIDNQKVDCYAKDIELSYKGTKFKVKFKNDDKEYPFETKLLGRNNIYNILGGIVLGVELGIKISDLQQAVKRIAPIEHRLSQTKYFDINIIDDAYNSNPMGCKMALEVLNMMPGKHIVVTPGMIEVGEKEYEVNREFGREIAHNSDEVILIGEEKTKPIYEGLMDEKYDKEKIHILNDVMDAFPLMLKLKEKDTYVLLENDLPDSFNEKIRSDKK